MKNQCGWRAFVTERPPPQLRTVAPSEEIEDALTRSYSSIQVIPSFQGIQAVVDLRVTSTSKSRTVVMPMAVVVLSANRY